MVFGWVFLLKVFHWGPYEPPSGTNWVQLLLEGVHTSISTDTNSIAMWFSRGVLTSCHPYSVPAHEMIKFKPHLILCMLGNFSWFFWPSAYFFSKLTFQNILSETLSGCQTAWIQIRPGILSILIWIQAVCKGLRLSADDKCHHQQPE